MTETEGIFTAADLVYAYSDAQAIDDGELVDLEDVFGGKLIFHGASVNRMTRRLFEDLRPFLMDASNPLMPDPTSETLTRGQAKDLRQTLQTKLKMARDTADDDSGLDYLFALPPNLWMVSNGTGGWTVMYPDEY